MRPTAPRPFRLRKTVWRNPTDKPSPRATAAPEQSALRAAYYRGGTSRAVILQPQDLPASHTRWRGIFRQVIGSVGLGEAFGRQLHRVVKDTASLGKICLVEAYHHTEENHTIKEDDNMRPHIDYTFISMDTKSGHLDVDGNCGDMLGAVGPYAYNARLLPPDVYALKDGEITIMIRNTNTMQLVESTFTVTGGQAAVTGSQIVDGVNGKGSKIALAFYDPIRSTTGKTFPTGRRIDAVEGFKVTCVDGAVPVVFIRADAIGVPGTILPHELHERKDKLNLLEDIRRAAAVDMGIANTKKAVPRSIPKIAIVSQSSQHSTLSGAALKTSQMDIIVRFISDTDPHPTIPLAGALTTAVAARMPGTIVEQLLAPEEVLPNTVTVAHPSGTMNVKLDYGREKRPPLWIASVSTTAQRLIEGKAFWTESSPDPKDKVLETNIARHACGLAFINELRLRRSPANLIERFYKEGHNNTTDFVSSLSRKPEDHPQSPPPQTPPKPDLHLPIPSPNRDTTHLLRELSTLRTSLTHFTSLYPSPKSPYAETPAPTPSTISDHLSAITSHINTLTSSLKHMPRPPRTVTPDHQKGKQWRYWAKTFSQWGKVRLLREADKKRGRRRAKKGEWERWRDGELNALSMRGRPVVMGERRRKLLQGSDEQGKVDKGGEKARRWRKNGALEGGGENRDGGIRTRVTPTQTANVNEESKHEANRDSVIPVNDSALPPINSGPAHPPPKVNSNVEKYEVDETQVETSNTHQSTTATELGPAQTPTQHSKTTNWPSFRDRLNRRSKTDGDL